MEYDGMDLKYKTFNAMDFSNFCYLKSRILFNETAFKLVF